MSKTYDILGVLTLLFIAALVIYSAISINLIERKLEIYDRHRETMDSLRAEYIEWLYRYHVVAENVKVYDTIQVPVVKYIYKTKRVEEQP